MYPEELVQPMRADLTAAGFEELRSAKDVDQKLTDKGTTLVYVNSICGCSARMGRPAVKYAVQQASVKPDLPMQAKIGDYELFFRKAAVEITFENDRYLVVPQAAILALVRDEDFDIDSL